MIFLKPECDLDGGVRSYQKFKLTHRERLLLLADFPLYVETATSLEVPLNLPVVRDNADQIFIMLAVVGNSDGKKAEGYF